VGVPSSPESLPSKNILITGLPGVGKTTLIVKLVTRLKALKPTGFYTAEIRERGERVGFELVGLDGRKAVLSHVNIKGVHRVGRYGVDVNGFDAFLKAIPFQADEAGLAVIDEIGKMECCSSHFRRLIIDLLESDKPLLATVAMKGGGLIAEVKLREDVVIHELTPGKREMLLEVLTGIFP
jgi:nucleoside-triphosphatase